MSNLNDIKITPQMVKDHGLTEEEYKLIIKLQGREPNFTELSLFSVMWSEHCSYKNSRPLLKTFPKGGDRILVGAGEENAGVIDIGNGFAISFKVESHNHPSAVEPFQGAATGVGGIIRDIFTMGAKPIALLNSLRFGNLENSRTPFLLRGVVSGISHYGNCIGIPTVGGEVYFEDCYDTNPLVNAMCLGIMRHEDIARGAAQGIGNSVMYVGAATGRDGIHGATFASEDLTEESESKRPAVQVGDPFMEKLLMEACLELYQTGHVVGIQDMGAAGIACSTSETAARGNSGLDVDLTLVPQRETGMTPYEILCSESQERMLAIVKRGKEAEVAAFFEKWDLHAVKIGEVVEGEHITYRFKGEVVAKVRAKDLTDNAPLNEHPVVEPDYFKALQKGVSIPESESPDFKSDLLTLLAHPSIASKRPIYDQYDYMVQTNTVVYPGSDAAVVRIKEAGRFLAMSADCNGRYCYSDPYVGSLIAFVESARNVVASGAKPIAVSNCLNFGNPYNSEVYWQLAKSIEAIGKASVFFDAPVTGGNVSLYNQHPGGSVYPTPVITMVGLIEKEEHITKQYFKNSGDMVYLVGPLSEELECSQFASTLHNKPHGRVPQLDLETEKSVQDFILSQIHAGRVESAHDISDGGLAVSILESCFNPKELKGVMIDLNYDIKRLDAALFGEGQSRFILSVSPENKEAFESFSVNKNFDVIQIGEVTDGEITINHRSNNLIQGQVREFYSQFNNSLKKHFEI